MNRFQQADYIRNLARARSLPPRYVPVFDHPIQLACQGDRLSIEQVALEMGARLHREACAVLGEALEREADCVVDEIFVAMLERRLPYGRRHDEVVGTLLHIVRSFARRHLEAIRQRDEEKCDPPP